MKTQKVFQQLAEMFCLKRVANSELKSAAAFVMQYREGFMMTDLYSMVFIGSNNDQEDLIAVTKVSLQIEKTGKPYNVRVVLPKELSQPIRLDVKQLKQSLWSLIRANKISPNQVEKGSLGIVINKVTFHPYLLYKAAKAVDMLKYKDLFIATSDKYAVISGTEEAARNPHSVLDNRSGFFIMLAKNMEPTVLGEITEAGFKALNPNLAGVE